jgi:hypothetical protein
MIRILLPCTLLSLLAACAEEAPPPRVDPAKLELLVARLEAQKLPPAVQKADRISGSVLKVAPEKIDPNVAMALITR